MRRFLVRFMFILCVGSGSGCGSRNATQAAPAPIPVSAPAASPDVTASVAVTPGAAECQLIPAPSEPGDVISSVALTDRVDPANAPVPSNESERLLFRQLYETLVRVDCNGRVVPGLAVSWRLETDGQTWIVTLRENARFADGWPLSSTDVRSAWSNSAVSADLRSNVRRLVRSVVAVDDRTLAITLQDPPTDAPL